MLEHPIDDLPTLGPPASGGPDDIESNARSLD